MAESCNLLVLEETSDCTCLLPAVASEGASIATQRTTCVQEHIITELRTNPPSQALKDRVSNLLYPLLDSALSS